MTDSQTTNARDLLVASSGRRDAFRTGVVAATFGVSTLASVAIGFWSVSPLIGIDMPKWVLARASGISSYLLMLLVTLVGLILSHPHRAQWKWPSVVTRLRLHVSLAMFTITFTILHLVVLALDEYAKVGWLGALIPMQSEYRTVPVTLGVIAFWSTVTAAVTAGLSGRFPAGKLWWPIHKVALAAFLMAWTHGVLAGSDTAGLLPLYMVTGGLLLLTALWRYLSVGIDGQKRLIRDETRLNSQEKQ